jgi:hypothetical protein
MNLGLELFIETEAAAAEARGYVAHIQSIGTFGVDSQIGDSFVSGCLHDAIQRAKKKSEDDRNDNYPSAAPEYTNQIRKADLVGTSRISCPPVSPNTRQTGPFRYALS